MLARADLDDEARDTLEHELADQARDRAEAAAYARGETPARAPVDTAALWAQVAGEAGRAEPSTTRAEWLATPPDQRGIEPIDCPRCHRPMIVRRKRDAAGRVELCLHCE